MGSLNRFAPRNTPSEDQVFDQPLPINIVVYLEFSWSSPLFREKDRLGHVTVNFEILFQVPPLECNELFLQHSCDVRDYFIGVNTLGWLGRFAENIGKTNEKLWRIVESQRPDLEEITHLECVVREVGLDKLDKKTRNASQIYFRVWYIFECWLDVEENCSRVATEIAVIRDVFCKE